MKIIIASDKSGFHLKEAVKAYLQSSGVSYEDVGTTDVEAPQPFFEAGAKAAELVSKGEAERAVLICGTGMGMSQVANLFPGVLAACCESVYAAKMCRAINNSNILTMGGWVIGPEMGVEMVKAFLETAHTQDLEPWRQENLKKAYARMLELDAAHRR